MRYDDAVASLFQGPLEVFVAERKRLAGELKVAGDKDGAAKLAKLTRPPISAWVVDQLWWHARAAFEAMFETARRLRDGKLEATAAHRDAVAKLRAEAGKILADAGHGATEATLRRVTQTLAALAAAGSWDPDPPGALSADRDPPGFEAIGISNVVELPVMPAGKPEPKPARAHDGDGRAPRDRGEQTTGHDDLHAARERRTTEAAAATLAERERREATEAERRRETEAAAARAEAAAELRRAEAERAKATAERQRLEAALRTARGDVAQREREVGKLERDLDQARSMIAQAQAVVAGLEERLAQLDEVHPGGTP